MQTLVTLAVIFPLLLWQMTTGDVDNWNKTTVSAVLFLGIFPSFLSYLFYGRCIEEIGAARAGLSIHLIPVFGVALSLIFLGETLHAYHVAGIVTILAGVALAGSLRIKHKNG